MTKSERTKIAKNLEYNRKQKAAYVYMWQKNLLINILFDLGTGLIVYLERMNRNIWTLSILWGPCADLAITGLCCFVNVSHGYKYANGNDVRGNYFLRFLVTVTGLVPWFWTIYYRIAPVSNWGFFKSIIMTPVSLLLLFIIAPLVNTPDGRLTKGSSMSINDLRFVKEDMLLAGLNPKAIPVDLINGTSVKGMSINDWRFLSENLKLAGWKNVFK